MSIAEPAATGWRAVLAEMAEGAYQAARRFPITAAALLVLAFQANLDIAGASPADDGDVLLAALFAAACASIAAHFFCEARGIRSPWNELGAFCSGLLAFAIAYWSGWTGTYELALIPALVALPLVAPFIGRGTGAALWLFGVRCAFAVLLAGLALLLFAGGVSAILASLTFLFGLELPEELYGHVWATTGLFAAPLFGLGQLPRDFSEEPDAAAEAFMDRGMRALGDFVAAPLFLLYAAVLHLYALKILLVGEAPEGEIGWLVLGFGFCTVGSLIVIHPFLRTARAPTRLFLRVWPYLLAVPLVLLFYALWLRIGEYGLTPDRYLLALFGLVLLALVLLQAVPRARGDIRYFSALPILALLFASFGPQGALKTSIDSQLRRFQALVADAPLEGARHDEALSALRFLHTAGAISRVTPEGAPAAAVDDKQRSDDALFREVAASYGIDPDIRLAPDAGFSRSYVQPAAFAATGFDVVVPSIGLYENAVEAQAIALPSGEVLQFRLDGNAVVVVADGEEVRFPIGLDDIGRIAAVSPTPDRKEASAEPLVLEAGRRRLMIVPADIHGEVKDGPAINSLNGAMLLRSSDWR